MVTRCTTDAVEKLLKEFIICYSTAFPSVAKHAKYMAMKPRPLSPHLQIYKPQISSIISILHRFAGLALCGGLVLFAYWLMTAASGQAAYAEHFLAFIQTPWGQGALLALTVCFFFYFLAELRYLAWAFGYGFTLPVMKVTGWLVVLGTAALTGLVWGTL